MRSIASIALAFALFAAPAALAASGDDCAGHAKATCCAKKAGATAADKKCDPATCKDSKKCTPEEKAKCAASCEKKAEAPKAPKS